MRNMWHGLARIIQRVPNEIYLKCDDIDSMDNSDMEETDIFMYAKSDPFDPFELAYPTDEREQNDDIIDDCTMEDDLYFLIGSSIVTPLLIADNFNHVVSCSWVRLVALCVSVCLLSLYHLPCLPYS